MFLGMLPFQADIPGIADVPPLSTLTNWVATDVFGFSKPLVMISGSGDKPFNFAMTFCVLVISIAATALWSVFDRRRLSYISLQKWFRLFLRFALGGTMLSYGLAKVIPLQMPYPGLTRLIEPYGQFSLMG